MKFTNISVLEVFTATFLVLLVTSVQGQSKDDKEVEVSKYKGKFLVVKREGISVGLCSQASPLVDPATGSAMNVVIDAEHTNVVDTLGCGLEPIHVGEVLEVLRVRLFTAPRSSKSSGVEKGEGYPGITVQNLSPHSIMPGIGAFAHLSMERGAELVAIPAGEKGSDLAGADTLFSQWFTVQDDSDSANRAEAMRQCDVFIHTMTGNRPNTNDAGVAQRILARLEVGEEPLPRDRKTLSRWCHTNGNPFQRGMPIARLISIAIYGLVIPREE